MLPLTKFEFKQFFNNSWALFWKMLLKVKQKVFEIFKLRPWEEDTQRCPEKHILKPICATIAPVLHLYFKG